MGYLLRAFIGRVHDLQSLATQYCHAVPIEVGQDLSLIPLTECLYDELNANHPSIEIAPFVFLTQRIEERVLALLGPVSFGYLEAEYFGGRGGQAALLWHAGQRLQKLAQSITCYSSLVSWRQDRQMSSMLLD